MKKRVESEVNLKHFQKTTNKIRKILKMNFCFKMYALLKKVGLLLEI